MNACCVGVLANPRRCLINARSDTRLAAAGAEGFVKVNEKAAVLKALQMRKFRSCDSGDGRRLNTDHSEPHRREVSEASSCIHCAGGCSESNCLPTDHTTSADPINTHSVHNSRILGCCTLVFGNRNARAWCPITSSARPACCSVTADSVWFQIPRTII